MDIKQNSPFPIVGSAKIIAGINIITIQCPCKNVLMGQMGAPMPCPVCTKIWFVSATSQIKIQEILSDLSDSSKASEIGLIRS